MSDRVDDLLRLLDSDEHRPVNLGSQDEVTRLELAQRIVALTGGDPRIVFRPLLAHDTKQRRQRPPDGWPRTGRFARPRRRDALPR